MNNVEEKNLKLIKLSKDVLFLSRNTLLVNMRFLDMALSQLPYVVANTTICTDGKYLYYDPTYILSLYKKEKENITRGYLHIIMHCIFRHMYVDSLVNKELWDLSCDIAVEASILGVGVNSVNTNLSNKRQSTIEELSKKVKYITAEKLYDYFLNRKLSESKIKDLLDLFCFDDHTIWYKNEEAKLKMLGIKTKKQNNNISGNNLDDNSDEDDSSSPSSNSKSSKGDRNGAKSLETVSYDLEQNNNISGNNLDDNSDEDDSSSPSSNSKSSKGDRNGANGLGTGSYDLEQNETSLQSSNDDSQVKFWKDVSEHIQQDLESFSKMQGMGAANMIQNLKEVNREKYDYTSFLKKFAVMGEAMKINDDEFDYVFYTYGLNRYGNMPLIEPLEYKDVKRIKEFVIAIDTSGSVSGKLVQTFLNKTYNILMSNESFFSKINIHIIQCDADIQEDKKITKREEFENYLKNMKLRGFGGTDFRPVFEYVDNLIKNREFINLKGLIYFTDGYGTFPKEMPDYKTAFIFIDEGYDQPEIPSWAIRLVLQKGDI